jgi:hypothetical protein
MVNDFEYNHKLWGYGGAMVNDFEYNHKLYGAMVNDFEFIQPFGGNRMPIDEGRKSEKKNPSDLNMVTTL